MVLVLQRRVSVMGPRIILRGAIPIDSNIGGSGHRPLLREARACSTFVCVSLLVFFFLVLLSRFFVIVVLELFV